jgi:hypothetical protein
MHSYELITMPSRGKPRYLIVKVSETSRTVVAECSVEHYAKLLIADLAMSNITAINRAMAKRKAIA